MKFKPMTRRFRVPGDTSNNPDSLIVLRQDEEGDVAWVDYNDSEIYWLLLASKPEAIAALGFPVEPTAEDEPPVETLVEVPA